MLAFLDLFLVVLILQLIASVVLICKLLWIKASAKLLNVNVFLLLKGTVHPKIKITP